MSKKVSYLVQSSDNEAKMFDNANEALSYAESHYGQIDEPAHVQVLAISVEGVVYSRATGVPTYNALGL